MTTKNRIIFIVVLVVIVIGLVYVVHYYGKNGQPTVQSTQPVATIFPQSYTDTVRGFTVQYPTGYTADTSYVYNQPVQGQNIAGVKFTIPTTLAQGTNLGQDSYISVEELPSSSAGPGQACSANSFLDTSGMGVSAHLVTDSVTGVMYSVASSTGAGAGNRYEETVYAITGSPQAHGCIAVRYFIHYSVFENYPAGSIQHFDHDALVTQFDAIRRTLVIAQ